MTLGDSRLIMKAAGVRSAKERVRFVSTCISYRMFIPYVRNVPELDSIRKQTNSLERENISDVLDMTVDIAAEFFSFSNKISNILKHA